MVGDIKIKYPDQEPFSLGRLVASGSVASINNGEPVKQGTAGAVVPMVDADGTSSQIFGGIAKSVSTDTATAAGLVYTWLPLPSLVYSAKAKTASLANTVALIEALQGKRVIFDLTASVYTVDTAAGDASTNAVVILGGDPLTSTIWFHYASAYSIMY